MKSQAIITSKLIRILCTALVLMPILKFGKNIPVGLKDFNFSTSELDAEREGRFRQHLIRLFLTFAFSKISNFN